MAPRKTNRFTASNNTSSNNSHRMGEEDTSNTWDWKSILEIMIKSPQIFFATLSIIYIAYTSRIQSWIGKSVWKRILVAWLISSIYLGWFFGVDYNYQPLSERELGFNVVYSVHKPFLTNIWQSASYHNITTSSNPFPQAFSFMDCINLITFGYFTYFFNGWYGSFFMVPLLIILDIPIPAFLFFDIIASGRKYNFVGFFPTILYYVIMVLLFLSSYLSVLHPPDLPETFRFIIWKKFLKVFKYGIDGNFVPIFGTVNEHYRSIQKQVFKFATMMNREEEEENSSHQKSEEYHNVD